MTYGLDTIQFRISVVRPVLVRLNAYSPAAENILMGTAMVESGLRYITQMNRGPARGLFQMEGATHLDIHKNFLRYRPDLQKLILQYAGAVQGIIPDPDLMAGNLYYAAAMCRVHYLRAPGALPDAKDALGLALLHKQHYNSAGGATDIAESVKHFQQAVLEGSV